MIPSGWRILSRDTLKQWSKASLAKFVKDNPGLAKAEAEMSRPSALKLYAIAPRLTDSYETALSVNEIAAPGITLGGLRSAVPAEIKRLPGVRTLKVVITTLPAGRCLEVSWNVPFTVAGLHQRIATLEYGFVHGGHVYFFQYTTGLPLVHGLTPVFNESATSISFVS